MKEARSAVPELEGLWPAQSNSSAQTQLVNSSVNF